MGSLKIGIKYVECKTFVMLCARRRRRKNITSVLLKKRWGSLGRRVAPGLLYKEIQGAAAPYHRNVAKRGLSLSSTSHWWDMQLIPCLVSSVPRTTKRPWHAGSKKSRTHKFSPHPTTKFTTHFSENHGTRGSLQPS